MFHGSIVALVTPFKDDKVDEAKIKELIDFQVRNGTQGIVPCGTTGESPTLSHEEHQRVVEICIEATAGRVPIIAGTGSNSTAEAISLTKHAAKAGAQAALVVTPYYNKPSQEGIFRHFKAIAESVDIPIILYNIAGRTARNIETPTVVRLVHNCKNIIGVKEASGSLDQMQDVIQQCPKNFILLSGDDGLTLPVLSIGGVGVISVLANIVPREVVKLIDAFNRGHLRQAREQHYFLLPLVKALFIDTNPIPVKAAMGLLGMCEPDLRLPLCPLSKEHFAKLKGVLDGYSLLAKAAV